MSRNQKTRKSLLPCGACGQTFEEKFNVKEHTNTNHEFLVFMTQKFKKHLKGNLCKVKGNKIGFVNQIIQKAFNANNVTKVTKIKTL